MEFVMRVLILISNSLFFKINDTNYRVKCPRKCVAGIYGLKQLFINFGDFDLLGRNTDLYMESCLPPNPDAYMWGRGIAVLILKLSGKIYVLASLPLGRFMVSTE
jgi:hypothetical protein